MHTLNLQASKLLKEREIEIESDYVVCKDEDGEFVGRLSDGKTLPCRNLNEPTFMCYSPNFQELLSSMGEIGKVLGWRYDQGECWGCGSIQGVWENTLYKSHKLLDIYLEKGMGGVSEEVIRLLDNT